MRLLSDIACASFANGAASVSVWGWAEMAAGGLLVVGLLSHLFHKRLPRGLGTSLLVWATMFGAGVVVFRLDQGVVDDFSAAFLLCAGGCALWAAAGRAYIRRLGPQGERRAAGAGAVFMAWSLVSGVAAAAMLIYVLGYASWERIVDPSVAVDPLEPTGLLAVAGLLAGVLFWFAAGPPRRQPAVLLLLLAMLVWWTSLMIPSASMSDVIPARLRLPWQPGWWTWTFQMQFGLSVVLVAAAIVQERIYRTRRRDAWPDRLDDLIRPYSTWPAYIQVEAVIAGLVLLLGVYQLVRATPSGWLLPLANCLAALAAGATCLFMTYRRWSGNTAGLGMALVTLGVVALACALTTPFYPPSASVEYADRMPVLFTAILFALAIMMRLWSWLSRFWDQQLLDGRSWTTAGRMIPYAERTSEFLAAIAVLVAFRMTLWPRLGVAVHADDGLGRIIVGGLAIAAPAIHQVREARRRASSSTAAFAVALIAAAVMFVLIRLPAPMLGRLTQYDAVVLCGIALPTLLLAEAAQKTRWRAFSTPLWMLSLLVFPFFALLELMSVQRLPAAWVWPSVLGGLAVVYGVAGLREHRRAFLVLGAVFVIAAILRLNDLWAFWG